MEHCKRRIFFKRKRWRSVVAATVVVAAVLVMYAANSGKQVEPAHESLPRCDSDAARLKILALMKRRTSRNSDFMKIDDVHETKGIVSNTGDDRRHCVAEVRIGAEERTVQFTMAPGGGEEGFAVLGQ